MLFTDLPLCDSLLEGLQAMNFKETTPVQELAIPVILEKKDVIACAQTGTGKTAAFLLPLLNNLQTDNHDEGKVNAIVMAPTRELAQQIDQMMEGFSYYTPFSSVAVYGGNDGEAWSVQKRGLLSGADVVIATPGRLLSHINLYNIDFSGVKYFILDEADRMLDMGFHEDIMKIEKLLPKDRQTVMFSATMPPKIQQLAKTIQRDPEEITIAISRPPETILQSAYLCHESQKIGIVKHLFKDKKPNKVLLFSGSKLKVKEIAKILRHMGLSAGEMHSDLDQTQRNHVMHEFRNERVDILVATDIVARGIDIDDITLVINFDVPYDVEDYVHRIGRTARAGDTGMAITFVSPDEQYRFSLIEKFLEKEIYRIPIPAELGETPEYNPVRDQRRRGATVRSKGGTGRKGKSGGKRDSKSSDRSGKPEGEERSTRPEHSEHPEREKRHDRGESSERPKQHDRGEGSEKSKRQDRGESPERLKRHDKNENPERAKKQDKSENPQRSDRAGRLEGEERHSRQEQINKPRRADRTRGVEKTDDSERPAGRAGSASQEGGERIERADRPKKSRPPREKEASRQKDNSERAEMSHSAERSKEGQGARKRRTQHKQEPRSGQDSISKQENTGKQGAPGKRKENESFRGKEDLRDTRTKASADSSDRARKRAVREKPSHDKKVSAPRTPNTAPKQEEATDKRKKWSWWPFGKK